MIERHWDGIAAYCRPENKVALGFVEGLNNKIRVIQRSAYGLHDEEYLRLKILIFNSHTYHAASNCKVAPSSKCPPLTDWREGVETKWGRAFFEFCKRLKR